MAVSKAQQKAVTRYEAKVYDKTLLRLPKGRLEVIKSHSAARGESVNAFIGRAIGETMERDSGTDTREKPQQAAETPQGTEVVSVLPETIQAAQRAAESTGETIPEYISRAVDDTAKRDKILLKSGINPAGKQPEKGAADAS